MSTKSLSACLKRTFSHVKSKTSAFALAGSRVRCAQQLNMSKARADLSFPDFMPELKAQCYSHLSCSRFKLILGQ